MSDSHAIIDIGSNTVRLVVYDGPARAPAVRLNEKVTARLGKDIARGCLLSVLASGLALSALARSAALLRLMGIEDVDVVATAAVRDAANGADFLAAVRRTGLSPRLLTGEEEALTSAMGVLAAFPGARGVAGDLGGGSLELTELGGEGGARGISLPYGTLRLPDSRAAGAAAFARAVRTSLRSAAWSASAGLPLFLAGGSWRALARYAMHRRGWPLDDPHGYELLPEEALAVCRAAARGANAAALPRISAARLASLPDAAALLAALVREIGPAKLVFSSWGLREGLLYRKLDAAARAQDPLLASLAGFAESLGVSAALAATIAGWTARAAGAGGAEDEKLRLAATMLALAAMRVEPNLRVEQAMNWALRKRWIGIDARGRAMLAAAILANSGVTGVPAEFAPLAPSADLGQAIGWGLAVRLCRKLTGAAPQAIAHTALAAADGRLVVALSEPMRALYSNTVRKDHRLLAEWLGLEPAVEGLADDRVPARAGPLSRIAVPR
jgi:exopolyphosphatase/guanosine-5'-triphosphate,3'-diphosphate pyrophosphatase